MVCKWGYDDCINNDDKCALCSSDGYYYKSNIKKINTIQKRAPKVTKRMGANFEYENNKTNKMILNDSMSRMTPNSGAGRVKGDEEIVGIINISEELKTCTKTTSRGEKQFTIKKEWLDKLNRESKEANREFWYLKFAFGDFENDWYAILESDMVMGMVKTMVEDRRSVKKSEKTIDIYKNRAELIKAENIKLQAEIQLLKAENDLLKSEKGGDVFGSI